MKNDKPTAKDTALRNLSRRHFRIGWVALFVYVTLGLVLETLHGFKAGLYLNVGNETRRLMWTLAHAHGLGLGLLQVAFAASLRGLWERLPPGAGKVAFCLNFATVCLPLGFVLGGIITHGGDPGIGVWLAPLGALALWVGLGVMLRDIFNY